MDKVRTPEQIKNARKSGAILTEVLDILTESAKEGVSAIELDAIAAQETEKRGAKPAFLNYQLVRIHQ